MKCHEMQGGDGWQGGHESGPKRMEAAAAVQDAPLQRPAALRQGSREAYGEGLQHTTGPIRLLLLASSFGGPLPQHTPDWTPAHTNTLALAARFLLTSWLAVGPTTADHTQILATQPDVNTIAALCSPVGWRWAVLRGPHPCSG